MYLVSFAQKPAFPDAEGYGRFTSGGRDGKIVYVTNLNDSGVGSLRQAVSGSDPKLVVFDVGGVIELKSDLRLGRTLPLPDRLLRARESPFAITRSVPTALESITTESSECEYYNLQGVRLDSQPISGIYLQLFRLGNGKTVTKKVVK